jgi:hypothetical protein
MLKPDMISVVSDCIPVAVEFGVRPVHAAASGGQQWKTGIAVR